MSAVPKVYIVQIGWFGDSLVLMAVCEDGVVLGSQVCNNFSFAKTALHDRHPDWYSKKFGASEPGDEYELVIADRANLVPEEVWNLYMEFIERNLTETGGL